MWMVDPKLMCRQHLLGEHNEIHKICGSLKKGRSITGYIQHNCIEMLSLESRHNDLVKEMISRGYNHNSPLDTDFDIDYLPFYELIYTIDRQKNHDLLKSRCVNCFSKDLNTM